MSPTLGRWLQMDPIYSRNSQSNEYLALQNSIVNYLDPNGQHQQLNVKFNRLELDDCGKFSLVINWQLNEKSDSGGIILQKITMNELYFSSEHNLTNKEKYPFTYWEIWTVDKGQKVFDPTSDHFGQKAKLYGTAGYFSISGEATFIEGGNIPDIFKRNCVDEAGTLFAYKGNEDPTKLINNWDKGTNYTYHLIEVYWGCIGPTPNYRIKTRASRISGGD